MRPCEKVTMTCLYKDKLHEQSSKQKAERESGLKHSMIKDPRALQTDLERNQKDWLAKHLCHPHPSYMSAMFFSGTHLRKGKDCTFFFRTHRMLLMLLCDCRSNPDLHGMKRACPPTRNSPLAKVAAKEKCGELGIIWIRIIPFSHCLAFVRCSDFISSSIFVYRLNMLLRI